MNVEEEYNNLINYYKNNPISKSDCYCETHHIIPKSCGGIDKKENLVNLPADIHYKVHCYLPFIYKNQGKLVEYHKMLFAWKRMLNAEDERLILYNIDENSKQYKILKEEFAKTVGTYTKITQAKSNNSNFGKHWYWNPKTNE